MPRHGRRRRRRRAGSRRPLSAPSPPGLRHRRVPQERRLDLDRDPRRARLHRKQPQTVGVGDDRAAGLGLPHVVEHGHAVAEDLLLEPFPGGWVQDLARADDPLDGVEVVAAGDLDAVAHQQSHGGRRGEDAAGDPVLVDDPVEGVGSRVVEGALVDDRGAAGQQRPVHDVAVADDPADVRGRPPHVVGAKAEAPASHGVDVDLVGPVRVHGQLGPRGGAGGGQDVGGLVGFHRHPAGVDALAERQAPRAPPVAGHAPPG